jgi:hypothetical protein
VKGETEKRKDRGKEIMREFPKETSYLLDPRRRERQFTWMWDRDLLEHGGRNALVRTIDYCYNK